MLKNVDDVINWLQTNDLEHFDVKTNERENSYVFRSNDDDPKEVRFEKFRKVMNLSTGSRYIIIGKKGRSDAKGNYLEEFQNFGGLQYNQQSNAIGSIGNVSIPDGYVSRDEVALMIQQEREAHKLEKLQDELNELKARNAELETPVNEFLRQIAPVAMPIISGLAKRLVPGIMGLSPQPETEIGAITSDNYNHTLNDNEDDNMNDEEQQRLEEALTTWAKYDADLLLLIEKIALLAQNDSSTYNMAKQMLLNK